MAAAVLVLFHPGYRPGRDVSSSGDVPVKFNGGEMVALVAVMA